MPVYSSWAEKLHETQQQHIRKNKNFFKNHVDISGGVWYITKCRQAAGVVEW